MENYRFFIDPASRFMDSIDYIISASERGWYINRDHISDPYTNSTWSISNMLIESKKFGLKEISAQEAYNMHPTDVIDFGPLIIDNNDWAIDDD